MIRLLHKESKSFWRLRLTVDLFIYRHFSHPVLEIICFCPRSCRELPRKYVTIRSIVEKIDSLAINQQLQRRIEKFKGQKKKYDGSTLLEEVTESFLVNYVTSKIEIHEGSNDYEIILPSGHSRDASLNHDLFCSMPEDLMPIQINHIAKTPISIECFQSALDKFRIETKAAQDHNEKAITALHSGHGMEVIHQFKMLHNWYISGAVKSRWMKVIKRIVFRNAVEKVKKRLQEIANKQMASATLRLGKSRVKRYQRLLPALENNSPPPLQSPLTSATTSMLQSKKLIRSKSLLLPIDAALSSGTKQQPLQKSRSVYINSPTEDPSLCPSAPSLANDFKERSLKYLDSLPTVSISAWTVEKSRRNCYSSFDREDLESALY